MSQNKTDDQNKTSNQSTTGTTGTTGAGNQASGGGASNQMTKTTTATATKSAPSGDQGVAAQAQVYGQKIADAAGQAKDYMSDKLSTGVDKLKDLQNVDVKQYADDAKDYARKNPGQALLISAAAGFLLGILIRGSRR